MHERKTCQDNFFELIINSRSEAHLNIPEQQHPLEPPKHQTLQLHTPPKPDIL